MVKPTDPGDFLEEHLGVTLWPWQRRMLFDDPESERTPPRRKPDPSPCQRDGWEPAITIIDDEVQL